MRPTLSDARLNNESAPLIEVCLRKFLNLSITMYNNIVDEGGLPYGVVPLLKPLVFLQHALSLSLSLSLVCLPLSLCLSLSPWERGGRRPRAVPCKTSAVLPQAAGRHRLRPGLSVSLFVCVAGAH